MSPPHIRRIQWCFFWFDIKTETSLACEYSVTTVQHPCLSRAPAKSALVAKSLKIRPYSSPGERWVTPGKFLQFFKTRDNNLRKKLNTPEIYIFNFNIYPGKSFEESHQGLFSFVHGGWKLEFLHPGGDFLSRKRRKSLASLT